MDHHPDHLSLTKRATRRESCRAVASSLQSDQRRQTWTNAHFYMWAYSSRSRSRSARTVRGARVAVDFRRRVLTGRDRADIPKSIEKGSQRKDGQHHASRVRQAAGSVRRAQPGDRACRRASDSPVVTTGSRPAMRATCVAARFHAMIARALLARPNPGQ